MNQKTKHFCVCHSMLYDHTKCGRAFREFRDATTDYISEVTCKSCLRMLDGTSQVPRLKL
jgi:hypothetical protein